MRTIAVINLKGGTGKTVTTISLATILVERYHKRVLIVDCDGQANLTSFYIPDAASEDMLTVANVLEGTHEPLWSDNVAGIRPGLFVLPGSADLYRLDLAAIQQGNASLTALRGFVEAVAEDEEIDVVLFDCPPGFTAASTAALIAASEVIIPVLMDGFSVEGMAEMTRQIDSMRQVNHRLKVSGVLINQWHRCDVVEQAEKLLRSMPLPVFEQVIRRTDKVAESTFAKQPVTTHSVTSAASRDFVALAEEIFGEVEQHGEEV